MSLKIYLDDCANDRTLIRLLQAAGHQVVTPAQAGIMGRADRFHFEYAGKNGFVLITKNPRDFIKLHAANPDHPGILLIYQDNDPDRDMSADEIVRAIANMEQAGVPFAGNHHTLNAWRY